MSTNDKIAKIINDKIVVQTKIDSLSYEELVKYFSTLTNKGYVVRLDRHYEKPDGTVGLVYPEHEEYAKFESDDVMNQLENGRKPDEIYEEAFTWIYLRSLAGDGRDLVEFFEVLHDYGYPTEAIDAFIVDVVRDKYNSIRKSLLWDIFIDNTEEWKCCLGINPRKYLQQFLNCFGAYYIKGKHAIRSLPEFIKVSELVNHFTLRRLLEITSRNGENGFYDFLTKVAEADACFDFGIFAKKFMDTFKDCHNQPTINSGKSEIAHFTESQYPDVKIS